MRRYIAILLLLSVSTLTIAANHGESERIKIWDNSSAPHSNNITKSEEEPQPGKLINTTSAEIFIFAPNPKRATGKAIIMCPGGGYGSLGIENAGYKYARWFAEQGVTAAVLKYRLPNGVKEVPFEDGVEALRLMRGLADKYGFSADSVGIAGASAGGHLAAYVSNMANDDEKPNFTLLFFPVITGEKGLAHEGSFNNLLGANRSVELTAEYSMENQVSATTPPAIIFACNDDRVVSAISSSRYYSALKERGVKASLHIYPIGGHAWSVDSKKMPYGDEWKCALLDWLQRLK